MKKKSNWNWVYAWPVDWKYRVVYNKASGLSLFVFLWFLLTVSNPSHIGHWAGQVVKGFKEVQTW